MKKILTFLAVLPCLAAGPAARAVSTTETFNFNALNLVVPDGNPAGLTSNRAITSSINTIESVTLSASLSGTFNGDLYAYVTHNNGISILLNRTGKTAASPFGYGDDGFSVTFDDTAAADIHTYQGSFVPPPGIPLSGSWQPDARGTDPDFVTDLSVRNAFLSSLNGGAASGDWTLFVADLSTGDTHTLQSWSLTVTGQVPEPGSASLLVGGMLLLARRRRAASVVRRASPVVPG